MRSFIAFTFLIIFFFNANAQGLIDSLFEDIRFKPLHESRDSTMFFTSKKVDFLQIKSSVTDSVRFAIAVYKPAKPSRIILLSHGWHQSIKPPAAQSENPYPDFLTVQVDMRGREYSTGKPDCNGYELYDFYDAYKYVIQNYRDYISDTTQIYFSGGSGGGGNGYAILGKFPDLFCSTVITSGISNYADWFYQDKNGEFRDDMIPWIGFSPTNNPEAYRSRSGITTIKNVLTPVYIIHGETDIRVPVSHARNFVLAGKKLDKEIHYLELKNVGTKDHWGNITKDQELEKERFRSKALEFRAPPKLHEKGRLIVSGYVVTKHFSVFMDSVNSIGLIKYNLRNNQIKLLKGKGKIVWK